MESPQHCAPAPERGSSHAVLTGERLRKTFIGSWNIEVACSKCGWKAAFNRKELMALYGPEYPLPDLLDHLAMPGCPKTKSQWDRCGVFYINPIGQHER